MMVAMGQKRAKPASADEIATTLRAARIFVGDAASDDAPVSAEEAKIIGELRRQLRRPPPVEIVEIAKKIVRKSR